MSTIFWEISKRNIRIHMLRSTLAMLGIIIGVVAIGCHGYPWKQHDARDYRESFFCWGQRDCYPV